MELIWQGLVQAVQMVFAGDRELYQVAWLTVRVTGTATLLSIIFGVPLGALLGLSSFPGRRGVQSLLNSTLGLPPVVVGLWVSLLLWRSGPLGFLRLMYTPTALIVAQVLIAMPRVAALTMAGVMQVDQGLSAQLRGLGANRWQTVWLVIRESQLSIMAACLAGFGAVVAEVGAAMAVGGNIRGQTRILSTAIVLEVNRGNFALALALSFVLMTFTYVVAMVLTMMQQRRHPHA
ncbi:MAG: ABC transporter permease [Peptococcaceae bacterium]|nr:ABC transporter permease [Peptococcaceae bacterium]